MLGHIDRNSHEYTHILLHINVTAHTTDAFWTINWETGSNQCDFHHTILCKYCSIPDTPCPTRQIPLVGNPIPSRCKQGGTMTDGFQASNHVLPSLPSLSGPETEDFHAASHLRDAAVFNNSVAVAPVLWRAFISDRWTSLVGPSNISERMVYIVGNNGWKIRLLVTVLPFQSILIQNAQQTFWHVTAQN